MVDVHVLPSYTISLLDVFIFNRPSHLLWLMVTHYLPTKCILVSRYSCPILAPPLLILLNVHTSPMIPHPSTSSTSHSLLDVHDLSFLQAHYLLWQISMIFCLILFTMMDKCFALLPSSFWWMFWIFWYRLSDLTNVQQQLSLPSVTRSVWNLLHPVHFLYHILPHFQLSLWIGSLSAHVCVWLFEVCSLCTVHTVSHI